MHTRRAIEDEIHRLSQSEELHFFRAERRHADFTDPDRELRDLADLLQFVGPFVNLPVIPVEWKSVHGHDVDLLEHTLSLHAANESRVDRRDPAEDARERGVDAADRVGGAARHVRKNHPLRIELEIPMREIVRFVPKHHRFNRHQYTSSSGCASISKPALRSIASTHARFGIHQFV